MSHECQNETLILVNSEWFDIYDSKALADWEYLLGTQGMVD